MPSESWDLRLSDVGRIVTGKTPPTSHSEYFGGTIPFVTPSDMDGRRTIAETERCLTEAGARAVAGSRVPAGAVMVSCIGSDMGKAAIAGLDCVTNQQINSIVVSPRYVPLFVYYNLSMRKAELQNMAVGGSAVPILNKGHFAELPIEVPPRDVQLSIARILGALDDKIELNRKMNETLEQMARAIFKSWFVDFEPFRDKGMVDSELGNVPKGWKVVPVSDICKRIFSGGTPSTARADYWGGCLPWLSSGETRDSFIIDTEKTITQFGVENSSTRLARAGSTVIAGAGQGHTRGQTSMLTFDSYINQSVVALEADRRRASDAYLFFGLERRYEEFRQVSDGHSSRGSLTTKLLGGLTIALPPLEVIGNFDREAVPAIRQITAALQQSRTLAAIRDALLPKLTSGEVRATQVRVT
jgi:type I restriction enzyme S subunit